MAASMASSIRSVAEGSSTAFMPRGSIASRAHATTPLVPEFKITVALLPRRCHLVPKKQDGFSGGP